MWKIHQKHRLKIKSTVEHLNQVNENGKIRMFVHNLKFLSLYFLQNGSTRFVGDCGKYKSLRASGKA